MTMRANIPGIISNSHFIVDGINTCRFNIDGNSRAMRFSCIAPCRALRSEIIHKFTGMIKRSPESMLVTQWPFVIQMSADAPLQPMNNSCPYAARWKCMFRGLRGIKGYKKYKDAILNSVLKSELILSSNVSLPCRCLIWLLPYRRVEYIEIYRDYLCILHKLYTYITVING